MSNNDPLGRRILPQQNSQMGTFSFAPQAYQQPRETQKSAHPSLASLLFCDNCAGLPN